MARVIIPTVVAFTSLMGVWVVFDAIHMVAV